MYENIRSFYKTAIIVANYSEYKCGGCLLGDTKILLNNKKVKLSDIVDKYKEHYVYAINPSTYCLTKNKIISPNNVHFENTIIIRTFTGKTIEVSENTRILVRNRESKKNRNGFYKLAKDIVKTDNIGVSKYLPVFGTIHNNHARLFGMIIGDGSFYGNSIHYCSEDDELWNYINENYDNNVKINRQFITKSTNRLYREGAIHNVKNILLPIIKTNKQLPDDWDDYDKESTSELLAGLFDTDGSCHIEEQRKPNIEFSSIHYELIKNVQCMLYKFGIFSIIGKRTSKQHMLNGRMIKSSIYYRLLIRGKENIELFQKNIKLLTHKQATIDYGCDILKNHKSKIDKSLLNTDVRFEKIQSINKSTNYVYDINNDVLANGIILSYPSVSEQTKFDIYKSQINKQHIYIKCINTNINKIEQKEIIDYIDVGNFSTIKIILENGNEVCGTYDHPILVNEKNVYSWKKLQDIKKNMEICCYEKNRIVHSKVINVEYTGKQHVYDLTVDKYHNFIANNIFVHNTNAKIVQIGTPKTRNHFYDAVEGKAHEKWTVVKRDWTQCAQLWSLDAIYLPDPKTGIVRPYSRFVLEQAMPKVLKQDMFPNNPEIWTEGNLSVEDFRTQYMLEFIDGAGKYIDSEQVKRMTDGEFDWLDHGIIGETYVAGIDFAGSNPDGDSTQISVLRICRDGTKHKVFAKEFQDTSYPQQMYYISNLFGGYHPRFECKKIFADYTGCGAAVVQTLKEEFGIKNLEGIIFNARDRFTGSGMNMKNIMYAKWRQELDNNKFKYMTKERFEKSTAEGAGVDNLAYYHRMISEWADLEQTVTGYSVNKKIEAPVGYHDDVCDSDVLANFAAGDGQRNHMPRPTAGRFMWH